MFWLVTTTPPYPFVFVAPLEAIVFPAPASVPPMIAIPVTLIPICVFPSGSPLWVRPMMLPLIAGNGASTLAPSRIPIWFPEITLRMAAVVPPMRPAPPTS